MLIRKVDENMNITFYGAAQGKKGILCVELNAGQMIEDVRLAVHDRLPIEHYGRLGGIIPSPQEIVDALEAKLIAESK